MGRGRGGMGYWLNTNRTQYYLTLILKEKKQNAYSSFKFLVLYLCSWTDGTEVQEEHLLLWMRLFEPHTPMAYI